MFLCVSLCFVFCVCVFVSVCGVSVCGVSVCGVCLCVLVFVCLCVRVSVFVVVSLLQLLTTWPMGSLLQKGMPLTRRGSGPPAT